jgi:hypothetical protein
MHLRKLHIVTLGNKNGLPQEAPPSPFPCHVPPIERIATAGHSLTAFMTCHQHAITRPEHDIMRPCNLALPIMACWRDMMVTAHRPGMRSMKLQAIQASRNAMARHGICSWLPRVQANHNA